MFLFMLDEIIKGEETVFAVGEVTLEGLLTVVDAHVRKQVTFLSECLFTIFFWAHKWPLSSVEAHMNLETASS